MIYKMTLKDSADEMTFDLLEVPIVDKDIEGAVDNVTLDGNQYTDYLWLKKQFVQKWSILCDDEYTRLRGFYTRQFENADVPSYRLYYGDDIIRNSTLSGERIELSISGVTDGTMSLTQIDGNTAQQTYTGKNLLNVEKTTQTVSGVTFTINADKTIIANGTASALITFNLINATFTLASGQYYLSGCPSGGSDSTYRLDINNGADGNQRDYGNGSAFTLSQSTTINNVRIRIASGATLNRLEFKPMINTGSTAQAYEPYVGGTPAPNPDYPQPIETVTGRQTVTVAGKNLWGGFANDFSKSSSGITFVAKTDGTITNTAGTTSATAYSAFASEATSNGLTKTLEAGTYCISGASGNITLDVCDTSGTTLATDSGNGATLTLSAQKTVFVRIRVASGKTLTAGTTKPLLESGNQPTTFEPYQGQSYGIDLGSVELCKIGTYQDRIYKENGKWWLEKQTGKVVLNGSEDWHKSGNTQVDRYWYNIYSGEVIPSFHQIYSDKFFYRYNVPTVNAMWVDVYQTLERLFVNYAPYGTTTVANLKTWLASSPTTVYYPLATPTTTEITNAEVLEGLEALQNESISVGQHTIYTDTPNALPTLTFDLTEYLSQSTTIIPETAVRLTLTDGGVINACGCRKDVQLTMRETIE